MSLLQPCSGCGQRVPGKYANTTWAWWRADNVRVAYRQRLCTACFCMNVAPLEVETREFSASCPACHIDTSGDMDPVYCTTFVPHVGRVRLELPLCGACAVDVRNRAMQGAEKLDDSGPSFGGQGAQDGDRGPQTDTPWSALGIVPR